jgi:hypothetical protein
MNYTKYYQIFISFLLFKIQILNLQNKQETKLIFDDVQNFNNLLNFFEKDHFSNINFYFISQSPFYLTDLSEIVDNEKKDVFIFRTRSSLISMISKFKIDSSILEGIPILEVGEYFSMREEKILKLK